MNVLKNNSPTRASGRQGNLILSGTIQQEQVLRNKNKEKSKKIVMEPN